MFTFCALLTLFNKTRHSYFGGCSRTVHIGEYVADVCRGDVVIVVGVEVQEQVSGEVTDVPVVSLPAVHEFVMVDLLVHWVEQNILAIKLLCEHITG